MSKIFLRKIKPSDKKYFAKWWRDKNLLKLTSGDLRYLSDKKIEKYFQGMYKDKANYHYMIDLGQRTIGNVSLERRRNNWCTTQIVIGEKKYWGKGYGPKAIKLILKKAERAGIYRIYLEVRPANKRAIKAYEKCGFKKVRIVKHRRNKYLPRTLRMELLIKR